MGVQQLINCDGPDCDNTTETGIDWIIAYILGVGDTNDMELLAKYSSKTFCCEACLTAYIAE